MNKRNITPLPHAGEGGCEQRSQRVRALVITAGCLLLSGCGWIGRQADHVGSYMPVIGERCEHWQCFTSEGQAISNANKAQRENAEREQEEKEMPADDTARKSFPAPAGR